MRQVRGKRILDLPAADFQRLVDRFERVVLDVGTGDGKHAYQLAGQRPDDLIIGLDAAKDNLRKVSARTDRANLLFLWAPVERLPAEVREVAEVHVLMPWGSLLRGMLGEQDVLAGLAAICRPGAEFLLTLNLHAWRPPVPEVAGHAEPTPTGALDELAGTYRRQGWLLSEARYLEDEEIARLATSWTRRLNSSRQQLDVLALTGTVDRTLIDRTGTATDSASIEIEPSKKAEDQTEPVSDSTKS